MARKQEQRMNDVEIYGIRPLSAAKVTAIIDGLFGLLAGAIFSLLSLAGVVVVDPRSGLMVVLFGVGSIILLPIVYASVGFITGLVGAWLYNLASGWVGGVRLEIK